MEAGQVEAGGGGRRCRDDRRRRAVRSGALRRRAWRRAAGAEVPARGGAAPVHSEGGWEEAAVGHPDGTGPGGPDGGEAGARADLRGRFSAVLVRISAAAERDGGSGNAEEARRQGASPRARCRHTGLLRKHRPWQADEARRASALGSADAQAAAAVARGRGGGKTERPRGDGGGTAGGGGFAPP